MGLTIIAKNKKGLEEVFEKGTGRNFWLQNLKLWLKNPSLFGGKNSAN